MNLAGKYHTSELDTRYTARLSRLLSKDETRKGLTSNTDFPEFEIDLQVTFDSQQKVENICLTSA